MTKAELYQKACMLPLLPGVYIIRDKSDTIIYIGKAKRLRTRVSQYFREGAPHDNKVHHPIIHTSTEALFQPMLPDSLKTLFQFIEQTDNSFQILLVLERD